jgi:B9 domain-containing protein 1
MENQESSFIVQCLGQIDSGNFGSSDYLYCRYGFSYGNDWDVIAGVDNGLSQTSCRNNLNPESRVVWNFPLDITFKATNVHGWPRIAISVYGIDYFGRDVVKGYGSALIPLLPGAHNLQVEMFTPVANSPFNEFMSWLMGNPPEVCFPLCLVCLSGLMQVCAGVSSMTRGLYVKEKGGKWPARDAQVQ